MAGGFRLHLTSITGSALGNCHSKAGGEQMEGEASIGSDEHLEVKDGQLPRREY